MSMFNEIQFKTSDKLPYKALAFLGAVGTSLSIREALGRVGYTQAESQYAWRLLHNVSGYSVATVSQSEGTAARAAIVELDELDEGLIKRAGAVLRRMHPMQAAFVLENLEPGNGIEAVLSVGTLVARLDALESSPAREATRADDHAALASLASRGITAAERTRLAGLVATAQRIEPEPGGVGEPATEDQRARDLEALRAWYEDWSETARAVIKRRDFRVRMGLSKRKAPKKDEAVPPTQPAVVEGASPFVSTPATGATAAASGATTQGNGSPAQASGSFSG